MDVLKILTRSTRHAKPNLKSADAPRLPSSGQNVNPQLYPDDGADFAARNPVTKKRKLSHDENSILPSELDFFAQGGGAKVVDAPETDTSSKKKRKRKSTATEDTTDQVAEQQFEALPEEECRRILRSHKIKITVLEDPAVEEQRRKEEEKAARKRRKKLKLKKVEEEAPKKGKKKLVELYPQPVRSFAELPHRFGVPPRLASNVEELEYKIPTEIQLGALPLLLERGNGGEAGECMLSVAPTGSGKTLAFLILAIKTVVNLKRRQKEDEVANDDGISSLPTVLIIAPTKELAAQIVNEGRKLAHGLNVKLALMKKGMRVVEQPGQENGTSDTALGTDADSVEDEDEDEDADEDHPSKPQSNEQIVKADVLVSTPLILLNSLKSSGKVSELTGVRELILDEADVLLDQLFRGQTLALWQACTNAHLRSSLWSATMGSNIESIVQTTVAAQRARHSLPPTSTTRIVIGLKDTAVPNISHSLRYCASEAGKLIEIRQLLRPPAVITNRPSLRPPFLIFTQTIPRALALEAELRYDIPPEAGGSARIAVLHARLSDSVRSKTLARFRSGEVWVLVTTDLLARGVDFRGLNGVVNYDVPNSAAAYVHRVGRTGRAGREGGVAVTLWAKEDIPYIRSIANVIVAAEKQRGEVDGVDGSASETQKLIDKLPTPSKKEKQELKRGGVEARRPNAFKGERKAGEGKNAWASREANVRISTKNGWERKLENNRRGARASGRSRGGGRAGRNGVKPIEGGDRGDDFEGFSD